MGPEGGVGKGQVILRPWEASIRSADFIPTDIGNNWGILVGQLGTRAEMGDLSQVRAGVDLN